MAVAQLWTVAFCLVCLPLHSAWLAEYLNTITTDLCLHQVLWLRKRLPSCEVWWTSWKHLAKFCLSEQNT